MDDLGERYNRIKDSVQQAILRNFPNPERKGCPAEDVIREVAARRGIIEDAAWQHITHCSPRYTTFLEYKDQFRWQRRRRGFLTLTAAAAALALGVSIGLYEVNRVQSYERAVLDFRNTSPERGAEPSETRPRTWSLPNRRLDLTVYLPFGSEPGKYELRLTRAGQALLTASGNAQLSEGDTVLHVRVDLSKYSPGNYLVAVRPGNWTDYPVRLK